MAINPYKDFKGVFYNKLNIDNSNLLEIEEYKLTSDRSEELLNGDVILNINSYNLERKKAIHYHLFQDVYDWAGQIRTVPSSKITQSLMSEFENPNLIIKSWENLEKKTESFVKTRYENFESKLDDLTNIFIEANRIHPFPEGNGRSLQVFMKQLAQEQNIELDFSKVNANEWNLASAVSGKHGRLFDFVKEQLPPPNHDPIKKIFQEISKEINIIENNTLEPIRRID
jgi:cell filamentation protein